MPDLLPSPRLAAVGDIAPVTDPAARHQPHHQPLAQGRAVGDHVGHRAVPGLQDQAPQGLDLLHQLPLVLEVLEGVGEMLGGGGPAGQEEHWTDHTARLLNNTEPRSAWQ